MGYVDRQWRRDGRLLFLLALWLCCWPLVATAACGTSGVQLQVLGSGGPELDDGRASTSYLLWIDGRARLLIDMGAGGLHNFEKSGARIEGLDAVLFTHLHVDHSNDLPALVKAAYFSDRERDLPLYGPSGNELMPAMGQYLQRLLGEQGAYAYLSDYVDGGEAFRLRAHDIDAEERVPRQVVQLPDYRLSVVAVHHGPIPALAWRIDVAGRSLVISGDMSNRYESLAKLARGADLLVAHHAIPESSGGVARRLHMPPSEIGRIARQAGIKRLLLSHRMNRTLGREAESLQYIRKHYRGPLQFAEDLACYPLAP